MCPLTTPAHWCKSEGNCGRPENGPHPCLSLSPHKTLSQRRQLQEHTGSLPEGEATGQVLLPWGTVGARAYLSDPSHPPNQAVACSYCPLPDTHIRTDSHTTHTHTIYTVTSLTLTACTVTTHHTVTSYSHHIHSHHTVTSFTLTHQSPYSHSQHTQSSHPQHVVTSLTHTQKLTPWSGQSRPNSHPTVRPQPINGEGNKTLPLDHQQTACLWEVADLPRPRFPHLSGRCTQ